VAVVDHRDERAHLREIEIHATTLPQPVVVVRSRKLLDAAGRG
jgi:hemin uptake protein HemP